ncbi:MAG: hypothetical protein M3N47_10210 [Chloroflexota bacterium]|nr:hypothetical protein [Chloroflexota bacterium]
MLLPIMVANIAGTKETAYFYIPCTISAGLLLIALHVTTSLTVEAALDETRLRELTRRSLGLALRLIVPLATVAVVTAPWLLVAFGSEYAEQGEALLRLLAVEAIPNSLVMLALAVSRIQHRGRMVLAIQAAHCVLVLGLSACCCRAIGSTMWATPGSPARSWSPPGC